MFYKTILISIVATILTTSLFSTNFSGKWELSTLGGNKDVSIKQKGSKMELFRVIEDENYKVEHLIMGKVEGLEEEKQYKLYVKDDDMDEFELLRNIPLKQLSGDELMLDGVHLKRLTPVIGRDSKIDDKSKNQLQKQNENSDENKKDSFEKDKNNSSEKDKNDFSEKNSNSSESEITVDNVIDLIPGGLSDSFSDYVKISSISSEKEAMITKGENLIAKKEWKKAASQFHKIEKKWKNSVVIYPHLLKIYQKLENQSKISYYCSRIKRFEPNHSCGGNNE